MEIGETSLSTGVTVGESISPIIKTSKIFLSKFPSLMKVEKLVGQ
jgi:hypothetical protein